MRRADRERLERLVQTGALSRQQAQQLERKQHLQRALCQPGATASDLARSILADAERWARTRGHIDDFARATGTPLGAFDVRMGDEARRRTEAQQAGGMVQDGVVWINPERYDPETRDGRALLGHELTHAAQRVQSSAGPIPASAAHAEAEAAHIGAAFGRGDAITAPRAVLPAHHVARDEDAKKLDQGLERDPSDAITGPDVVAKVDLLKAMLEEKFWQSSAPAVRLAERFKLQIDGDKPASLKSQNAKLDKTIAALETMAAVEQMVPKKAPNKPEELRLATEKVHKYLKAAVPSLGTDTEGAWLTKVQDVHLEYMDALSAHFVKGAGDVRSNLPSARGPADHFWFTEGQAYGGSVIWTGAGRELKIYQKEILRLRKDMKRLGDLKRLQKAPLGERLEFMAGQGDEVASMMRRAQGLAMLEQSIALGAQWMKKVRESGQTQAKHILSLGTMRALVTEKLAAALTTGQVPDAELLVKVEADLKSSFERAKEHVEEIEAFEAKMDILIDVVSTIVGVKAMTTAMKALTGVKWLYSGGKMALRGKSLMRFAIGSLAFTSGSAATRALITQKIPGAGELLQQAGMDFATLGILNRANAVVGYAMREASPVARSVAQHGTAFGTLWAWSSGWQLATQGPDGEGFEGVVNTLKRTGTRTAIDLVAINLGFKLSSMPALGNVEAKSAAAQKTVAEWDALRQRGANVGKLLEKWSGNGRKQGKVDALAREAQSILAKSRGLFDRMRLEGILSGDQAKLLTDQANSQQLMVQNFQDAARLGVKAIGSEAMQYQGSARNMDQFLRRLQSQGLVKGFSPIGDKGAFQVRYADGTTRWFSPRGSGAKGGQAVDFTAEALERVAPKVDKGVREAALESLRGLPATEVNKVTAALKAGEAEGMIRWLARHETATALASKNTVFTAEFLERMMDHPRLRTLVQSARGTDVQAWWRSRWEKVAGRDGHWEFGRMLEDIQMHRGDLRVGSAAEALEYMQGLRGSGRAGGLYDPKIEAGRPAFRAVGGPRKPYRDTHDYLSRNGYVGKSYRSLQVDGQHWVLRFDANGLPLQVMKFAASGYPPRQRIDLGRHVRSIESGLKKIDALVKAGDTAGAKRKLASLGPSVVRLAMLKRVRGVKLHPVFELMDRVAHHELGSSPRHGRGTAELEARVRQQHPTLETVDPAKNLYKVVIDGQSYYGTLETLLDVKGQPAQTFALGEAVFTKSGTAKDGTKIESTGGLAGTSAQNRVNPFPGDIDLAESIKVTAKSKSAAATALAERIQETVKNGAGKDGAGGTKMVFLEISAGAWPKGHPKEGKTIHWTRADVARGHMAWRDSSGQQRVVLLSEALTALHKPVNMHWRGPIDATGTYGEVTKVMRIEAFEAATGKKLFGSPEIGQGFQEVAFGKPQIQDTGGDLAGALRPQIAFYANKGNWLKAAKRAYTVARTGRDLKALEDIGALMGTEHARLEQVGEHLRLFAEEVVQPAGVGQGALTDTAARSQLLNLAKRVDRIDPDLAGRIRAGVGRTKGSVRGDKGLFELLNRDVLPALEQKAATDASYAQQAYRVLKKHGYLTEDVAFPK